MLSLFDLCVSVGEFGGESKLMSSSGPSREAPQFGGAANLGIGSLGVTDLDVVGVCDPFVPFNFALPNKFDKRLTDVG